MGAYDRLILGPKAELEPLEVLTVVSKRFSVKEEDITQPRSNKNAKCDKFAFTRHFYVHVCSLAVKKAKMTETKFHTKVMGAINRHRTCYYHSLREASNLMATNEYYRAMETNIFNDIRKLINTKTKKQYAGSNVEAVSE